MDPITGNNDCKVAEKVEVCTLCFTGDNFLNARFEGPSVLAVVKLNSIIFVMVVVEV